MKSKKHLDSVFVIYDTQEGKLWNSNGTKIGWVTTGAAKNAWNLCSKTVYDPNNGDRPVKVKFDEQTRYVIVQISELLVRYIFEGKSNDNE
ncbi:hypothetical protein [Enterobacter phage EC152]|jgi:hypothetical protein|uniref:Uncharacterized protein n=1 Tax=Cronobacter phage vB_CsaM_GAP31 TaxID=1141135 RepID=K4F6G6_9CAUD|nr:hypothetical protein GAP31_009 [Cronobacter phage vB_CsaM_GAP31]AFC21187.1 hypothetical protein GAP31_009 [Cronobacter phage vB_CsaM_GAP31]